MIDYFQGPSSQKIAYCRYDRLYDYYLLCLWEFELKSANPIGNDNKGYTLHFTLTGRNYLHSLRMLFGWFDEATSITKKFFDPSKFPTCVSLTFTLPLPFMLHDAFDDNFSRAFVILFKTESLATWKTKPDKNPLLLCSSCDTVFFKYGQFVLSSDL